jgi:hypothetical protein
MSHVVRQCARQHRFGVDQCHDGVLQSIRRKPRYWRDLVTRLIFPTLFSILALATALIASSAQAQLYDPKYPVCMHVFGELQGERMDCIFTSLPQCQATASGLPASCLINPYFVPATSRRKR